MIQNQHLDQLLLLGFGQKWPHYAQNWGSFNVKMTQMYVYYMKNDNLIVIWTWYHSGKYKGVPNTIICLTLC